MSGDLETDTLLTNTGIGTITSNDYAKLIAKNEQLELVIKRLIFERDYWKKIASKHENVQELTIELDKLTLHSQSSQQNRDKQVLRQQLSTDGHNSFQSEPHHSRVTLGNTSEVSLPWSPHHPTASALNSLSDNASVQSDTHHSRVTLGDLNEGSLKYSSHYQPSSTQNSVSANASVTKKSKNQTHPILEEPPQQPPVKQPEDSETKGEIVMAEGGRGGYHFDKPGILSSLQTPGTRTEGTPTQVTPSQDNVAFVPGTTANPTAASVTQATNSQVSRKRYQRSIKGRMVSDEMILFVEGRVIKKRRDFVRKLGLTDDHIDEIEETYPNANVIEIVHKLLHMWKGSKGIQATVGALLKGLKAIERKDVYDAFCKEFSISSDEDIPNEEQNQSAVPQDAKMHQESFTKMPIQAHAEHEITRYVVPSIENIHKKSEPAQLSNFDSFFSDFMLDSTTKGKKLFRKDLDKKKNFKREETKQIANEMDWDSTKSDKFDTEVKANLKVSNVFDKWAGILLEENPHMTKAEKRDHIQDMVRSLRGEKDGREDVIAEMRKHIVAGTVGTQAKPNVQYTDLPYGMRYRLVLELNMLDPKNGGGCSLVAEKLGIENNLIRYLTTRPEPGHQVLRSWETQADATVGKLYDVLIHCEAMKAVAVLE